MALYAHTHMYTCMHVASRQSPGSATCMQACLPFRRGDFKLEICGLQQSVQSVPLLHLRFGRAAVVHTRSAAATGAGMVTRNVAVMITGVAMEGGGVTRLLRGAALREAVVSKQFQHRPLPMLQVNQLLLLHGCVSLTSSLWQLALAGCASSRQFGGTQTCPEPAMAAHKFTSVAAVGPQPWFLNNTGEFTHGLPSSTIWPPGRRRLMSA